MNNLLTLHYWFNTNPPSLIKTALYLFIAFLIILLIILIISFQYKEKTKIYKTLWRKIYNFSSYNLIIGIVFLFFNYESIPFFSSRFWLALWLIMMLIWILFIFKEFKKIPERKKKLEKKDEFKKYLP